MSCTLLGDLTVVFKYAPYLNRTTGSAVAVGLADGLAAANPCSGEDR